MKINNIIKPTLVLFVICLVISAALGATNLVTKDKIAQQDLQKQTTALKKVLPADSYSQKTITLEGNEYQAYIAKTGGSVAGYAFSVSAPGYGGDVSAIVAIATDGTIKAVEVTDVSNETPGLGQNAKNKAFLDQFSNKRGPLAVVKSGAGDSEIDAITGATITSKAVTSAVNKAVQLFETVRGDNGE